MKGYRFIDPDWEPIRRILIIFGWIITIALIILVIRIIPEMIATNYYKSSRQETHSSNEQGAKKETDVSEDEDVVISVSEPSNSPHYVVSHVRDGDTIEVLYNGTSEQAIRMIGVDTPETVHPDIDVECYGPEASAYTKNRLEGKEVGIELDDSQGDYDSYGRVLAYVYIDGENFNLDLIKNGYGYEYTYDAPYKYQKAFKDAERYAITNALGLWNECEKVKPANLSAL